MNVLNQVIEEICVSNPGVAVWIAGDANLPDIDWATDRVVGHQYPLELNESFLQMLARTGMEQLVDFPTRNESILDIIITNRPSLINRCEGLPALGDHDIVYADWNAQASRVKPSRHKIFLWNRADFDLIRQETKEWADKFVSRNTASTPVELLSREIEQYLQKTLHDKVPSKLSSTRFNQPWFNTSTKRICRRKARAFKKARKTNRDRDWKRFRRLKKQSQITCRQAYNKYLTDIIRSEPGASRRLGAIIKAKRCDQAGIAPLKEGNHLFSDPKTKANLLNRQFASVFTKDDTSTLPDLGPSNHPPMNGIQITNQGIVKLLKNLNPYKASGPDGVPARLLKETAEEIAPAISLLYQASLDQGSVPSSWKKALVVPIFKKGSRSSPANYRPISLTAILCKLCEHVVHSAIINHLSEQKILSDAQHGFRKRRSCDTQLILTIDDLAKGIEDKGQTDMILLDFAKAFDKVSHRLLLHKLQHYGIRGPTLQWVTDFLSHRTQQVLVDGQISTQANVSSGVPQGSVLGPLLFLAYINDLPDCVKSSTTRLFADDTALYKRISSHHDASLLQEDLNALEKWENTWLMQFHPAKCQVVRVTKKRQPITFSYSIHGITLEEVSSAKYLGLHIDNKLNFNDHVDITTKKANSTRAFLQRNFYHSSRRIKEATYTTYVRPTAEYAAAIWDPHTQRNIKKVEQVQRNGARYVTNTYDRRSSVTPLLSELQWPSLQSRRRQSRLTMLYRIHSDLVDISWKDYITEATSNTRGHDSRIWTPYCSSQVFLSSFFPRTSRDWNSLKKDPAAFPTLDAFKTALRDGSI
ncbi:uncharacterized protein [Amphiura filiformis]|uniref:uncharacterized protein n=1 Tax=Amphiura filiformis TaxID=82378 RepID=UPI003B221149